MQSLIAFSSFGRAVSSLFLRLQHNVTMARKRNPTLMGVNTDLRDEFGGRLFVTTDRVM
jgi:hypothetical protein